VVCNDHGLSQCFAMSISASAMEDGGQQTPASVQSISNVHVYLVFFEQCQVVHICGETGYSGKQSELDCA
jgi:hypothetical protein